MVRGTSITFPGEQLMRLSSDWASGAAGVLSALRALRIALGDEVPAAFRLPILGVDPLYQQPQLVRGRTEVRPAA